MFSRRSLFGLCALLPVIAIPTAQSQAHWPAVPGKPRRQPFIRSGNGAPTIGWKSEVDAGCLFRIKGNDPLRYHECIARQFRYQQVAFFEVDGEIYFEPVENCEVVRESPKRGGLWTVEKCGQVWNGG